MNRPDSPSPIHVTFSVTTLDRGATPRWQLFEGAQLPVTDILTDFGDAVNRAPQGGSLARMFPQMGTQFATNVIWSLSR